ncbi:MAG: TIGR03016 family PEP-CTERM system-associated outer membrane protein [Candidatus Thiodiazotropha endolucinida]
MIINKLNHLNMEQIFGGKPLVYTCLACGMGLAANTGTLYAADWVISPSIGIQQIYTDNANLTHEDEVSDNITVVRPTLSIYKEGARANLDFNYAPEYRHYWDETEDNEVVHFMRTEGNVEIAENHFYLDGWLRADRTNITSTGRSGIGGLTGTEDDTDYYSVGLSPYFTARLGDFSVVEVRFTGDRIDYSEDLDNDSTGRRGEIAFGNGSMFTNQIWEVLYQQSDVDYENLDDDNETKIFRAELIQKITNQWSAAFSAGYEEYDLAVADDRDDSTWSIGAIYTPNPRTRFALGVGERSFGDDYYFDFSHRTGRTIWTASYEQDFVSARDELSTQPLFERQDAFGNLVRDPILESSPVTVRAAYSPSITEDFYESKRFTTEFTYQTTRTSINLRGRYLERLYDRSGRDTEDIELSVLLTRRLARLTSGYIQISGIDHEEEVLVYDQLTATLGVSYQFGTNSRVGFSITHLERDADTDVDSYEENHASLNVTSAF